MHRLSKNCKTISIVLLSLALFSLAGCSKQAFPSTFNAAPFKDSPSSVSLCFDLRDDNHPVAGLVLKVAPTDPAQSHTVALPFDSKNPVMNREIFSTWGSYDGTTLITYYSHPSSIGIYDLGFVPGFGPTPVDQWSEDPRELSESSIFFVKSSSFTRHFVFRFPEGNPERNRWLQNVSVVANTTVDSIGVVLPPNIDAKAIRKTNRTSVPDPIAEIGIAKFYPATQNAAKGVDAIHVKYELPPTQNQKAIIEEITRTVILFIAPAFQFIVRNFRKPENRKRGKRMIWVFGGIQVIVFIALFYLASVSWQESVGRAAVQLLTAILAGLFTAYNLWEDKKNSTVVAEPKDTQNLPPTTNTSISPK